MYIKIEWAPKPILHPGEPANMYNVYECQNYYVEIGGWTGTSNGPSIPNNVTLILDEVKHTIELKNGDRAYIMNDAGKTIDRIFT